MLASTVWRRVPLSRVAPITVTLLEYAESETPAV